MTEEKKRVRIERIIIAILILAVIVLFSVHRIVYYEAVHIDSLDRVCKELTNDDRASFENRPGAQKVFECRTDKKISEIVQIQKWCRYDIGEYYRAYHNESIIKN